MEPIKATVFEPVTDTRPEPPPMGVVWTVVWQEWCPDIKGWFVNVGYANASEERAQYQAASMIRDNGARNVRVVRIDTGDKA